MQAVVFTAFALSASASIPAKILWALLYTIAILYM